MSKILPIVAIVGPPNAGKSTLLNKIAGVRLAVTSALPGTTRDRQYLDVSWNGVNFSLVDTAGLNLSSKTDLENSLQKQVGIALLEADVLLMVADGKEGRLSIDKQIIKKFQKSKKSLVLAVNKLDSPAKWEEKIAEFMALGVKNIYPVSALSGRGIGDLLDYITDVVRNNVGATSGRPNQGGQWPPLPDTISVGIIGKPNVGKSSIFNQILKEQRTVISPISGTTRTAIDSQINFQDQTYTFIDTAGLKRKAYRQEESDMFGGFQTYRAIRRSDVCFFVLDAAEELAKQDQHIAQEIFSQAKGIIILANKVDLMQSSPPARGGVAASGGRGGGSKDGDPHQKLRDYISDHLPFLWMCPLFFVSGITGEGIQEAMAAIKPIFDRRNKKIDDETLSEFLKRKLKLNPPKLLRDQKNPKVFALKQIDINPPKFELLVNHPAAISTQFRKFLENGIIKDLDFYGTPIVLRLKGKDKS